MSAEPAASGAVPDDERARHARGLLLVSSLFFGAMAVAVGAVSSRLGAAQVATVRFAIGLVCVLAAAGLRPGLIRISRPGLLFGRGLFGGLAVLLYFVAIGRVGAGLATLLNYMFPLWGTLFAALALGDRTGPRVLLGMAVATAGLVVVVGAGGPLAGGRGVDPWGLLAGLVSGVSGGVATTAVRAARRTESALAVFGAFCLVGGSFCLPFAWQDWRPIDPATAGLLVLVGLLSFVAQVLYTHAFGFVTTGEGAPTTQFAVVVSYGLGAWLLGQRPSAAAIAGGAIVMAGVVITNVPWPGRGKG